MTGSIVNLDNLSAQHAQRVIHRSTKRVEDDPLSCRETATDVDNLVTKALGVLQENGLYAFALYLLSRKDKDRPVAVIVTDETFNLLASMGQEGWERPSSEDALAPQQILEYLTDKIISEDLERVILAKETVEQMLIYARYGAKARGAGEKP